jgi:hypothetical protein
MAVSAEARGRLRVSDTDRDQVIDVLKAAFVQGRLAKDEFDLRVGQALASRTYADLAALTADLPPGLAAAQPPPSTWAAGEPRIPRPGLVLTVATVVYPVAWPVALALPNNDDGAAGALIVTASLFYLLVLLMIGTPILADWLNERFARQLPGRPGPGAGGQATPVGSSRRPVTVTGTPPKLRGGVVPGRHFRAHGHCAVRPHTSRWVIERWTWPERA